MLFIFLLTTNFAKNNHIYARIFFIFLKNVLNKTWNAFNSKFWHQWKDQKSSYQVREDFALFCNLIALSLGYNSVKSLGVTKIVKEIKFEGVWDKLESKNGFKRESFAKYLRLALVFMWNSAPQEKFNCYFSGLFC